jgi:hypothetical protein
MLCSFHGSSVHCTLSVVCRKPLAIVGPCQSTRAGCVRSHLIDGRMPPHGASTRMERCIIETRRGIPLKFARQCVILLEEIHTLHWARRSPHALSDEGGCTIQAMDSPRKCPGMLRHQHEVRGWTQQPVAKALTTDEKRVSSWEWGARSRQTCRDVGPCIRGILRAGPQKHRFFLCPCRRCAKKT